MFGFLPIGRHVIGQRVRPGRRKGSVSLFAIDDVQRIKCAPTMRPLAITMSDATIRAQGRKNHD